MGKREEFLEIARSQIGYQEGYNNDTKYGAWYGLNNEPWCAMFCSWCCNEVGMLDVAFPKFAGCTTGFHQMSDMGITTKEHIIPEPRRLNIF